MAEYAYFTDCTAAIEEGEWSANQEGRRYALVLLRDLFYVIPADVVESGKVIEVFKPVLVH